MIEKPFKCFNKREVSNDIYNDFKEYMTAIEEQTNSYTKFENIISDWKAGEGFYEIAELISESTDWDMFQTQQADFRILVSLEWNRGM